VCVWARAPWTAGISRPGFYLSGRVAAGLAPSTIVNPIDRLVVALRFFELVEGWSRSGPRACGEDLSGEERAWRRANSSCRVGRRGYCGFDLILAFAGPRFRAGKNFLPEILGSVFLGRNLLPVFNFGAGFWIEGGANLLGFFLLVFSGAMVLDSLFCRMKTWFM